MVIAAMKLKDACSWEKKNATGYKTVLYGIILILESMHSQRAIFNPTNTDMQNMAFLPPLRQLTDYIFWLQNHCRW